MTHNKEIHLLVPLLRARLIFGTLLVVLCVSVVTAIPAMAESQPGNGNSNGAGSEISTQATDAPPAIMRVSLPDAPTQRKAEAGDIDRKVVDKKYIFAMAALGGSESLRFTAHQLVLAHEFAAGAPWVASVPSNQHLVAKYAGIYAAELVVAYELKKRHSWLPGDRVVRKLWWTVPAAMTPIHIKNGIRSIRTQPPADAGQGQGQGAGGDCPAQYQQYCGGQ